MQPIPLATVDHDSCFQTTHEKRASRRWLRRPRSNTPFHNGGFCCSPIERGGHAEAARAVPWAGTANRCPSNPSEATAIAVVHSAGTDTCPCSLGTDPTRTRMQHSMHGCVLKPACVRQYSCSTMDVHCFSMFMLIFVERFTRQSI